MKKNLKEPCNDCPFRRQSLPGWLGADTAEGFMRSTMSDCDMPCHQSVDYNDADWEAKIGEAETCAGASIFYANLVKMSRDRDRQVLPADRENVFGSPAEFVKHHENTRYNADHHGNPFGGKTFKGER